MAKRPSRTSDPHAPTDATATAAATPPAKPPIDPGKMWQQRLDRSNKRYDSWAKRFKVEKLAEYYLGKQWDGLSDTERDKRYVINLIFATIETQLPSLLFQRPRVVVDPRPDHDTPGSDVAARATLIEQTIQSWIDDPKIAFGFETTLALRDAYARFGLVEVGYTADWIDNPQADKPVLKADGTEEKGSDGEPVRQPKKILKSGTKESLYVRRINPAHLRVSPGRNRLEANDWVAYWEWANLEDVKADPNYQNTDDLKASGTLVNRTTSDDKPSRDDEQQETTGQVKLWKIYDLRAKTRTVHADGHKKLLQENVKFSALPLADLKFYEIADAYYPLPPLYNWKSPQDEINESRQMAKVHRRRFVRRYMREPSVKPEEFEKLENGEDGVCIEVPHVEPAPIAPIMDAPLDGQNWTQLAATKDDFLEISGVSGTERGNAGAAKTATGANIASFKEQMRESRMRLQVADWLADIARLMLIVLREKMQLPFLVKREVDPFAMDPQRLAQTAKTWQEVQAEDLDELDVDVRTDVTSLSPAAEQAQVASWNQVLQLLTNPALVMLLMVPNPQAPNDPSPMLRKTLALNGIRNEQEVREIWRVGQVVVQFLRQQQAMAAQAAGGPPALGPGAGQPGVHRQPAAGIPAPGPVAG